MGNNYGHLKLEGAKAVDAIKCMSDSSVLDASTSARLTSGTPQVEAFDTGTVWLSDKTAGSTELTAAYVAAENTDTKVGVVDTPTISATGKVAERITAKARACVYKAPGLTS